MHTVLSLPALLGALQSALPLQVLCPLGKNDTQLLMEGGQWD